MSHRQSLVKRSVLGAVVTTGLAVFVDFDVDLSGASDVALGARADAEEAEDAGSEGATLATVPTGGGGSAAEGVGFVATAGLAAGAVEREALEPSITASPMTRTDAPDATAAQITRFFDSLLGPDVVANGAPVAWPGAGVIAPALDPDKPGAGVSEPQDEPTAARIPPLEMAIEFSTAARGTPKASASSLAAIKAVGKRWDGSRAVARLNQISKLCGNCTPRRAARTLANSRGPLTTCKANA